jgi:hypothetical protein
MIILRFHRTRIINSSSIASAEKANKQTNKQTSTPDPEKVPSKPEEKRKHVGQ